MTKNTAAIAQFDIGSLRAGMYDVLTKRYGHLPGHVVLASFKEASEDLYESGMDQALHSIPIAYLDNVADAWDLAWLAVLAVKLSSIRK